MSKKMFAYNRYFKSILIAAISVASVACTSQSDQPVQYDTLIMNGKVFDGTGDPVYDANIAVKDGEIMKIGELKGATGQDTIDAKGLYVTPGFIDEHSHAASGLASEDRSVAKPLLLEGITTVVVNPDGGGSVDLKEQRERLLKDSLGVNVAQLVPFGSVRRQVMGMEDRAPTAGEMEEMKQLVE